MGVLGEDWRGKGVMMDKKEENSLKKDI